MCSDLRGHASLMYALSKQQKSQYYVMKNGLQCERVNNELVIIIVLLLLLSRKFLKAFTFLRKPLIVL